MTGIFLLLVIVTWVAIVIWLSQILTEKLPKASWRIPIAILVFAVLLPLPLIDEIVGGRQFELSFPRFFVFQEAAFKLPDSAHAEC
jgi:hypothetical protein